jgi:hypothetical protein
MKRQVNISDEEKFEILLKYCEKKNGYKETHDFLEKVMDDYDPISYAVIKTTKELEKRCR